jgi:hypothetical protein
MRTLCHQPTYPMSDRPLGEELNSGLQQKPFRQQLEPDVNYTIQTFLSKY